ncbi:MAG: amidinotransferase [Saprospiraceae bacterium]|nr:amidinotransferase [Saprospiraceae bacterium]
MVRPANFGFNEETAANNAFQKNDSSLMPAEIKKKAIKEFDDFVYLLRQTGVDVTVVEDTESPFKTDAVFPNNWVTFHSDGTIITYPMYSEMRRRERREDILEKMMRQFHFNKRVHLEKSEVEEKFLEGTGSMILDREHEVVYACLSPRTDITILDEFCKATGYEKVVFNAVDGNNKEIYHTNVMMALSENFVVICMDTIKDEKERDLLLKTFKKTNKEVIKITLAQMMAFAGNMLQVKTRSGDSLLVMSEQAFLSLDKDQVRRLNQLTNLLYSPLYIIEKYGGGSARCMMAEIFAPA